MQSNNVRPARHLFKRPGAICAVVAVLTSASALARYVPDTTIAPGGAFDVELRGDAAIVPAAVYRSADGDGFVTIGHRDNVLAVCAFTKTALLQTTFGDNGCHRQTLAATDAPYQLLAGKSGYWVLLADTSNARRFALLRLTVSGQADTAYGPSGRRTFDLSCDTSDTAPRCPEVGSYGAQQLLAVKSFIAETSDSAPVGQSNVVLAAPALRSGVDPSVLSRWAMQADGSVAWQRVTLDPSAIGYSGPT